MYTRQRITDSVSVNEMLEMRERGMRNAEIANALGCSTQTVLNYIGKQPKELRASSVPIRKTQIEEISEPESREEIEKGRGCGKRDRGDRR